MAVYVGAHERSRLRPARPAPTSIETGAPAVDRRHQRSAIRAGRRSSRVGLALGGIAIAFILALFSLAQTIRVSATSYDIDQLIYARDQMTADQQQLRSDLSRLGNEPAIRKQAFDLGMSQLGDPLVVAAR
jgi:hypothetical protein